MRTELEYAGTAKPRRNDEEQLQKAIVEYLHRAAKPHVIWFAIPNGEKRSKATAGRLKAMGVRAGVADLCIFVNRSHAAFVELKVNRNKQSAAQVAFQAMCEDNQIPYAVVTSFEMAVSVFKGWGVVR